MLAKGAVQFQNKVETPLKWCLLHVLTFLQLHKYKTPNVITASFTILRQWSKRWQLWFFQQVLVGELNWAWKLHQLHTSDYERSDCAWLPREKTRMSERERDRSKAATRNPLPYSSGQLYKPCAPQSTVLPLCSSSVCISNGAERGKQMVRLLH